MKTMKERIVEREIILSQLKYDKEKLEAWLKRINKKILTHEKAIQNLKIKDDKIEYDRSINSRG